MKKIQKREPRHVRLLPFRVWRWLWNHTPLERSPMIQLPRWLSWLPGYWRTWTVETPEPDDHKVFYFVAKVVWDDEDECWYASSPDKDLPGLMTHGYTVPDALWMWGDAMQGYLTVMQEHGLWPPKHPKPGEIRMVTVATDGEGQVESSEMSYSVGADFTITGYMDGSATGQ